MPRIYAIDRALDRTGRGPRVAAGIILLLGLIVVAWSFSSTQWKRRVIMRRLDFGDDTTRVVGLLGPPVRCPRATEAIRDGVPKDWPPPVVESTTQSLSEATAQRWIYAINLKTRPPCGTRRGHTEIGVDSAGRMLWYISVTGRTPIRVPDEYTPSGGS